jgi:uncharacterized protein YndB with AHSA1/START domain
MEADLVATASVDVNAPIDDVWKALVSPKAIKQYMFGATVVTDWREGSPITWKGEWKGKAFEDSGTLLQVQPPHLLKYTHFSPSSGAEDKPENYHMVTFELKADGKRTRVAVAQDNNRTDEARVHSEKNWQTMLDGLKKVAETSV